MNDGKYTRSGINTDHMVVWDDHDENCHGAFMDFEDDEDYAQAFIWQCCGRPGNDPGCKITRHKSKTNTIIAPDAQPTKKRKATDTLRKPKDPQCANCGKRYDPKNNSGEGGHCFFHSGNYNIRVNLQTPTLMLYRDENTGRRRGWMELL